MTIFKFLSKYFWVIAFIVSYINYISFKNKSKKYIEKNPELEEGYKKILKYYLLWQNIPWIIMGIGMTFGKIPYIWYYFKPKDGNPFVISWYISVILLWVLGSYWIFFKNGAETIVKYPGAFNVEIKKPIIVKLIWIILLAFGIFGFIFIWNSNIPIPEFN